MMTTTKNLCYYLVRLVSLSLSFADVCSLSEAFSSLYTLCMSTRRSIYNKQKFSSGEAYVHRISLSFFSLLARIVSSAHTHTHTTLWERVSCIKNNLKLKFVFFEINHILKVSWNKLINREIEMQTVNNQWKIIFSYWNKNCSISILSPYQS